MLAPFTAVGAADGAIVAFVTLSAAASADAASVSRRLRLRGIAIVSTTLVKNRNLQGIRPCESREAELQ